MRLMTWRALSISPYQGAGEAAHEAQVPDGPAPEEVFHPRHLVHVAGA